MPSIPTVSVSHGAVEVNFQDANSGGDSFAWGNLNVILINNGSDASITVTFDVTATDYGQPVEDVEITVAAGEIYAMASFPAGEYADASGNVDLTYSSATDVTVAVLSLAP